MKEEADDFKPYLKGDQKGAVVPADTQKSFLDLKQERINLALSKLDYYKKATAYLGAECQEQRKKISAVKKNTGDKEDDHRFYEMQIKKEREESLLLKSKIAKSIDDYENFILRKFTN